MDSMIGIRSLLIICLLTLWQSIFATDLLIAKGYIRNQPCGTDKEILMNLARNNAYDNLAYDIDIASYRQVSKWYEHAGEHLFEWGPSHTCRDAYALAYASFVKISNSLEDWYIERTGSFIAPKDSFPSDDDGWARALNDATYEGKFYCSNHEIKEAAIIKNEKNILIDTDHGSREYILYSVKARFKC